MNRTDIQSLDPSPTRCEWIREGALICFYVITIYSVLSTFYHHYYPDGCLEFCIWTVLVVHAMLNFPWCCLHPELHTHPPPEDVLWRPFKRQIVVICGAIANPPPTFSTMDRVVESVSSQATESLDSLYILTCTNLNMFNWTTSVTLLLRDEDVLQVCRGSFCHPSLYLSADCTSSQTERGAVHKAQIRLSNKTVQMFAKTYSSVLV